LTLGYDPETGVAKLIGNADLGDRRDEKWEQIEFATTLKANMDEYPAEELGRLFEKNSVDKTFHEQRGIKKIGTEKVFEATKEKVFGDLGSLLVHAGNNLPPFMMAAACEHSAVPVIYPSC